MSRVRLAAPAPVAIRTRLDLPKARDNPTYPPPPPPPSTSDKEDLSLTLACAQALGRKTQETWLGYGGGVWQDGYGIFNPLSRIEEMAQLEEWLIAKGQTIQISKDFVTCGKMKIPNTGRKARQRFMVECVVRLDKESK